MTTSISRRGVIGAPLLLAGCGKRSEYFGNTAAPARRTLRFALGPEPDGLDPAGFSGGFEQYPIAGLATHYEINRDDTRLTFFLRGQSYLQNPFVRGLPINLLDLRLFKYASIGTNWRAQ